MQALSFSVLLVWLTLPVLEIRLVNMAICPGMGVQSIKKPVPGGDNLQLGRERPRQSHVVMSNPAALLLAKAHPVRAKAALRTGGLPVGREPARRAKDRARREEDHQGNLAAVAINPGLNGRRAVAGYKILEVRLNRRSRCFPCDAGKHRFCMAEPPCQGFCIDCIQGIGLSGSGNSIPARH
ncbi:MAG TPA: hypothetical protein VFS89_01460 [Nitrosospira sp.]|nr:hypothetical protein [Nitrosospira sp.]